jgi:transcriptional regulator with XRE-family HTH domain
VQLQALAPAATDVELEAESWTPFRRPRTEGFPKIPCKLSEFQTPAGDTVPVYGAGTVTASAWVPVATQMLVLEVAATLVRHAYRVVDFVFETKQGFLVGEVKLDNIGLTVGAVSDAPKPTLPESALIAREVRDVSGLSAQKLGEIFPVERESYQRWMSGKTVPSADNLERLLALRHFFSELSNRIADAKTWLFAPFAEEGASGSRFDALKAGKLTALWESIADLPSKKPRHTREMDDGTVLTVTEGALRGRDIRTSPEELDNYEEWLSEDE